MVKAAVKQFGSVDILVNNAGIFGLKPFLENTEDDVDKYININLKADTQMLFNKWLLSTQSGHSTSAELNIGTDFSGAVSLVYIKLIYFDFFFIY